MGARSEVGRPVWGAGPAPTPMMVQGEARVPRTSVPVYSIAHFTTFARRFHPRFEVRIGSDTLILGLNTMDDDLEFLMDTVSEEEESDGVSLPGQLTCFRQCMKIHSSS